jgi:flagellar biosynthetic protein FlhB
MSEEDKSQKTEEPTEKKLADERKKGNVPNSKEVGTFMSVFGLMIIVVFVLPTAGGQMVDAFGGLLKNPAGFVIGEDEAGLQDIGVAAWGTVWKIAKFIFPIFIFLIFISILAAFLQGEVIFALERIKPKKSNISPISGLKKIYSISGLVEFAKSIVKVTIVGVIAYFVIRDALTEIIPTYSLVPSSIPNFIREKVGLILIYVMSLLAAVAVFDMIWKRMEHRKKLRMSMKEIKDEMKQTEGDPHMKAKLAQIRKEKSRSSMMRDIPTASVIITNPTHFSVALRYDSESEEYAAPICIGKGVDNIAFKIREIASDNNIPIVESPPLARALYSNAQLDEVIPYEHWKAVAEIISYIMAIDSGQKNIKTPEGVKIKK